MSSIIVVTTPTIPGKTEGYQLGLVQAVTVLYADPEAGWDVLLSSARAALIGELQVACAAKGADAVVSLAFTEVMTDSKTMICTAVGTAVSVR